MSWISLVVELQLPMFRHTPSMILLYYHEVLSDTHTIRHTTIGLLCIQSIISCRAYENPQIVLMNAAAQNTRLLLICQLYGPMVAMTSVRVSQWTYIGISFSPWQCRLPVAPQNVAPNYAACYDWLIYHFKTERYDVIRGFESCKCDWHSIGAHFANLFLFQQ